MSRRAALAAVPLTFLALAYLWPVGAIIARGLAATEPSVASPLTSVLTDPAVWRVVRFTVGQAALSTLATLVVGLPGALLFARYRFRGRRVLEALVMLPFVLPTIVVGAAFVALTTTLAPVLDLRESLTAIVAAHVFFNHAVVVRTVGALWADLDPAEEEAARTLGASPVEGFRRVTLPRLAPGIAAASLIVLLFTSTSFGIVLLLGGPTRATLEVEIHRVTTQNLDIATAAALALLQLAAVGAALAASAVVTGRARPARLTRSAAGRRPLEGLGARTLVAVNIVIALGIAAPMGALVARSLRVGSGWGIAHYLALLGPARATALAVAPRAAVAASITLALAATIVALVVGLAAASIASGPSATGRLLDRALMLPLGTSSVTIGLGVLIAFGSRVTPSTAILLVPLAQALIAVPFVVRVLVPALRGIDERLREAARTLGADPRRVMREIDLPIVARALAVAAGFAFAVALGEFGATVFLARATLPTVPTAIFRLLGRPGSANAGQASALAVVLAVMAAGAVLALDRARLGREVRS